MRSVQKLISVTLLLALSACISGRPEQTSYTSPTTGKTTLIQTDRETCESSCNEDYNRCMDSSQSSTPLEGTPPGMFGVAGECRKELSECMPGCKAQ